MARNQSDNELAKLLDEMVRMTAPAEEITAEILALGAAEPLAKDASSPLSQQLVRMMRA